MQSVYLDPFKISIDRHGAERYTKISYPVRCGRYGEIKTKSRLPTCLYLIQRL